MEADRQGERRRSGTSIAYATALAIAFLLLSGVLHLPREGEHWSTDFLIANLSTSRYDHQYPQITLVFVSQSTLKNEPYVSPVDRKILADLIRKVDEGAPKAIGLDFALDRYTEPQKDSELKATIGTTKAKIVLAALQKPAAESDIQADFLAERSPNVEVGHIYFDERSSDPLMVSDHVIRLLPPDDVSGLIIPGREGAVRSFSKVLAGIAGSKYGATSPYIDWLLTPRDGKDIFATVPAEAVLAGDLPPSLFHNRIVLIGGNFEDRDQHLTPLSVTKDDFYPGLFIHAQVLAQLLDRRSIREMGEPVLIVSCLSLLILATYFGYRFSHSHFWVEFSGVTILAALTLFLFLIYHAIVPFNYLALCWLFGAFFGHVFPRFSSPAHPQATH